MRGFTLLEVLLTIAIIALLGGVLIGGSAHLLSEKAVTSDEVFWQAVREARKAALKAEHEIRLKFDKENKQFILIDGLAPSVIGPDGFTKQDQPLKTFKIPPQNASDLSIDLLGPAVRGGSTILVGGMLVETRTIEYVTFYSDGTCSQFRAQFASHGSSRILSIDPWTCAPVLPPADPNAPNVP